MEDLTCQECGTPFEKDASFCPKCGKKIDNSKETITRAFFGEVGVNITKKKGGKNLIKLSVFIVVLGVVAGFTPTTLDLPFDYTTTLTYLFISLIIFIIGLIKCIKYDGLIEDIKYRRYLKKENKKYRLLKEKYDVDLSNIQKTNNRTCPKCQAIVTANAHHCPICGTKIIK